MTPLRRAVDDYLALRRKLGVTLEEAGRVLTAFAAYAEQDGAPSVTTALMLRWAAHFTHVTPATLNGRFQMIRRFAQWRQLTDARTEVPPADLRLVRQQRASPHTIASYRDAFRLLLRFAQEQLRKAPSNLALDDLDAALVGAFLDHVEQHRRNTPRTRNVRLAAIHAFCHYVAISEPAHLDRCRRILAIPVKRHERRPIAYLTRAEIDALIAAPDVATWIGRRDRALLLLAIQTGLRVSELIHLRCGDIVLGTGAHLRCEGKGRKQRCTPIQRDMVGVLTAWVRERNGQPGDPLVSTASGTTLSRDAVERLVARHTQTAQARCPSLKRKHVSPQVGEKCRHLGLTHVHGMAFVMKPDVATDPPDVRLFGPPAEMPQSNRRAQAVEQLWRWGSNRYRGSWHSEKRCQRHANALPERTAGLRDPGVEELATGRGTRRGRKCDTGGGRSPANRSTRDQE